MIKYFKLGDHGYAYDSTKIMPPKGSAEKVKLAVSFWETMASMATTESDRHKFTELARRCKEISEKEERHD